jgi:hypothetical protein
MQVTEGIHRIATQTDKPLYLYALKGEEETLLLDTGMAHTPGEIILPFFVILVASRVVHAVGPQVE